MSALLSLRFYIYRKVRVLDRLSQSSVRKFRDRIEDRGPYNYTFKSNTKTRIIMKGKFVRKGPYIQYSPHSVRRNCESQFSHMIGICHFFQAVKYYNFIT